MNINAKGHFFFLLKLMYKNESQTFFTEQEWFLQISKCFRFVLTPEILMRRCRCCCCCCCCCSSGWRTCWRPTCAEPPGWQSCGSPPPLRRRKVGDRISGCSSTPPSGTSWTLRTPDHRWSSFLKYQWSF